MRTHLGRSAVALRPGQDPSDGSEVELDDGTVLHTDAVVLAVGVTSRVLDGQPDSAHLLRAVDEAERLRDALASASSLLVVGAGFIGAEVASTARDRGVAVTVVETGTVPMARLLGEQAGAVVARLMVDAGVDLRTGVAVSELTSSGATLSDGSTVTADEIVVGVGGMLDLGWLEATGVDVSAGIPCDHRGRVDGLPGVWAAGDAAAWTDPDTGEHTRLEHWTSASDQAAAVAADITGTDLPPAAVPFFWSDQFGMKIQLVGWPDRADSLLPLHGGSRRRSGEGHGARLPARRRPRRRRRVRRGAARRPLPPSAGGGRRPCRGAGAAQLAVLTHRRPAGACTGRA